MAKFRRAFQEIMPGAQAEVIERLTQTAYPVALEILLESVDYLLRLDDGMV